MKKRKQIYAIAAMMAVGSISSALASSAQPSYPIDSKVVTTAEQTVVPTPVPEGSPKLLPTEVSKYSQYGYGRWEAGPGALHQKRLDLMAPDYSGTTVTPMAKLTRFFTFTDIHITDKETPAQAIVYGFKGGVSSAYSPIMLYTTHVLDATVQTVNAIHKKNPIDFGLSLGDASNNSQYNETRWYIDILDGKKINPDSGDKDDPIPGPLNDYQDVYQSAGLDKSIPWYQVRGNHDHLFIGFLPHNEYSKKNLIGKDIINVGNVFAEPSGLDSRGLYHGSIDGRTVYGDVIGVGPEKAFPTVPQIPAADEKRRALSGREWLGEFLNTSSSPAGHGFTKENIDKDFACYSFEPKAELPLKVIVLDNSQKHDDPNNPESLGYGHASLDQQRYDWLVKELDQGQAEGKLMVIASHIPIGVEAYPSMMGWSPYAAITEGQFVAKLQEYSNLILWVAGHRHLNDITAFKTPDPTRPELGFWQVETSSLRDFPQQFRTFEIVRNSDNTISIFATAVDAAVKAGTPAAISRSYAVAAQQIFNNDISFPPTGVYNAELVKQLSPDMQLKIQHYGKTINK